MRRERERAEFERTERERAKAVKRERGDDNTGRVAKVSKGKNINDWMKE